MPLMARLLHRIAGPPVAIVGVIILGVLVVFATNGGGARTPPDAMLQAIEAGAAPRILDVRTTREYAAGHVPGAIHIPYHEIWLRAAELSDGRSDPIVVYCSHGVRAGMAEAQLWTLGYDNVSQLQGQMSGWKRRGLPMRTGNVP